MNYVIAPDETLQMPDNEIMDIDNLNEYLNKHKALVGRRYMKLKEAYMGDYPILHQNSKETWKPDNRIVVNFAKYIVDTMNGYFIGIPIKVSSEDETTNDYINMLDKYNDQDDNNAELSKICSIYGKGYEMYYVDDKGNIAITYLSPLEAFIVYDESIIQKPRYFINVYRDEDNVLHGQLRTSKETMNFTDKGGLHFIDTKPHGFEDVPASEYIENEERMAIFESVYSMINEYNKAISEKSNDVDYFADAYLKILGAHLDDDNVKAIRDDRVINLEGSDTDNVVVEFMDKPNSDTTQENLINRLERLIFQNSMIANMNDEDFGNASGISLRYKLLSMSNLAKTKERKFTSGMNRRYRLIFSNPANSIKSDDWMNVEYKFSQNYPANILEEAQIAAQLEGLVSKETQLSVLSIVEDVKKEIDTMDEEEVNTSTFPEPSNDETEEADTEVGGGSRSAK